MSAKHEARVSRRGSGYGYRCSCGEEPNQSSPRRRDAERWARLHEAEHARDSEQTSDAGGDGLTK